MNVKDVIANVVTAMKPTIDAMSAAVSGGGSTVTCGNVEKSTIQKLFVGERVKLTYSGSTVYGYISSIAANSFIITLPSNRAVPPSAISVILTFHHGHRLEIVNTIKEATHSSLKQELFPIICLLHDFTEKVTFEREATVTIVIVTDTKKEFSASQRYTYSFDKTLTPLYELFMSELINSANVATDINYLEHDKTDRLFWGKNGLYGNEANIFNDFIDAIEIENLKFKIINTC